MYPLVGRLDRNRRTLGLVRISIHAPLAGCDAGRGRFCRRREDFNPRTPCGVRQFCQCRQRVYVSISIHAPLAGCDDGDFRVGFFLDGISIHAPLAGCDECDSQQRYERLQISIHAPLAGCDSLMPLQRPFYSHFNPRTPCGVRPSFSRFLRPGTHFNPRTPCGVRHYLLGRSADHEIFQSTHPLRGATRLPRLLRRGRIISIHAPLAGCDARGQDHLHGRRISIHAPLAGCDPRGSSPVQAARYFNPRTPCGVRPLEDWRQAASWSISIHAPLAGCDPNLVVVGQRLAISIHAPLAGCDAQHVQAECVFTISIHAPLAGCDGWTRCRSAVLFTLFQSTHPLRGATLCGGLCRRQLLKFQSTHPLRGATALKKCMARSPEISIHAPLAGCDAGCGIMGCWFVFQSTHPLRGATRRDRRSCFFVDISIHAPLAGCDCTAPVSARASPNFNPRTPCGVRPNHGVRQRRQD